MRKNTSINKENNAVIILLFSVLLIICPRFSYAANTVQVNTPLYNTAKIDDGSNIEMLAMGTSNLGGGEHQVKLLLTHNRQYRDNILLQNKYTFKLIDNYDQPHSVTIKDIKYSDQCQHGILSHEDCQVTLTGYTNSDDNTIYKSYSVSVPFRHEKTSTNRILTFTDSIPELEVQHSLEKLSPQSGNYVLSIKNVSEETININSVTLGSKCISLDKPLINVSLDPDSTYKIEFKLGDGMPKNGNCAEYINIIYSTGENKFKYKTMFIPIEIRAGSWWGWKITVGTPIVVIVTATLIKNLLSGKSPASLRFHNPKAADDAHGFGNNHDDGDDQPPGGPDHGGAGTPTTLEAGPYEQNQMPSPIGAAPAQRFEHIDGDIPLAPQFGEIHPAQEGLIRPEDLVQYLHLHGGRFRPHGPDGRFISFDVHANTLIHSH